MRNLTITGYPGAGLAIPRGAPILSRPQFMGDGSNGTQPVTGTMEPMQVRLNPAYRTLLRSQQARREAPREIFGPGMNLRAAAQLAVSRRMQLAPPARVKQPPWVVQPASAPSFTYTDNTVSSTAITLPAVGAFGVVVTFKVPAGRNGAIDTVANQLALGGFTDGSGTVLWYLTVDGLVYKGFAGIKQSIGTMSNPQDYSDKKIRVFENQTWQLLIYNVALFPGAGVVQGLLAGYTYSITEEVEATYV